MNLSKDAVLTMQDDMPVINELLSQTKCSTEVIKGLEGIILSDLKGVSDAQHLPEIAMYLSRVCLVAYFQGFDNDVDLGTRGTNEDVFDDEDDEGEVIDEFSSDDFL